MANATTTTNGTVILGGDLAGSDDGSTPELRASGVAPGVYDPIGKVTVDNKGRVVHAARLTKEELRPYLTRASRTNRGLTIPGWNLVLSGSLDVLNATTLNQHLGVFSVDSTMSVVDGTVSLNASAKPPATKETPGFVQVGAGLNVTGGRISRIPVPDASRDISGLVRVSQNLTVVNGELSLPDATSTTKGLVQIAEPLQINNDSVVSIEVASHNTKGIFQPGEGLDVVNGVLDTTYGPATVTTLGLVKFDENDFRVVDGVTSLKKGLVIIGNGLAMNGQILNMVYPTATTTQLGIVRIGSQLNVNNGIVDLNLPIATTSTRGIVSIGDGLTVANGVVSKIADPVTSETTAGVVRAGLGMSLSADSTLSVSPLPLATADTLGAVQIGANLGVDQGGVLSFSIPKATATTVGAVTISQNGGLNVADGYGYVTAKIATKNERGLVKPGYGMSITEGNTLNSNVWGIVQNTSATVKGVSQFTSTYLTANAGVISLKTTEEFKPVTIGPSLGVDASGGILPGENHLRKNAFNIRTRAQNTASFTFVSFSTATNGQVTWFPFWGGSNVQEVTLNSTITLSANSSRAYAGGVYDFIVTQGTGGGFEIWVGPNFLVQNRTIAYDYAGQVVRTQSILPPENRVAGAKTRLTLIVGLTDYAGGGELNQNTVYVMVSKPF